MTELTCFKAYDIRGQLGVELNDDIAYRIGRAYAEFLKPSEVVVGGDIRLSSAELVAATVAGLRDSGVDVIDLGMVGTEQIYFATSHLKVDGGIEITASHNPIDFNGMKLVRHGSRPISSDSGLLDIKRLAEDNQFLASEAQGTYRELDLTEAYVDHLLGYIDHAKISPIKLVVNAGNGSAGPVVDAFEERFKKNGLPIEFIKIFNRPDGTFPHGIPNPSLHENRGPTVDAVIEYGADMGIAWDGDFDRCFFVDELGRFIEGYYIVGLLAEVFLSKNLGASIVHDPRLIWNTLDIVRRAGGRAVQSKTGHSFIKERMRQEKAIYGGEMSAHHYFKDFYYCDSGMIPWLLVVELICSSGLSLSQLVDKMLEAYPSPGEINRHINSPYDAIFCVRNYYQHLALQVDETDGLSMEFEDWRFNLRLSNTEAIVRLNIESRGNIKLMERHRDKILALLDQG